MTDEQRKLVYSVPELSKALVICEPSAYRLVKRPDFPKINIGKRVIVPISALEDWMNKTAWSNEVLQGYE